MYTVCTGKSINYRDRASGVLIGAAFGSLAFLVSRILRICWLAVTFPLLAAATAALSRAAVAGETAYQSVVAKRTFSGLRSVCVSLLQ